MEAPEQETKLDDEKLKLLLNLITEDEFRKVLEVAGLVRDWYM